MAGGASAGAARPMRSVRWSSCATISSATWRRPVAGSRRTLELRIGDARDALDRFEAARNRRSEGAGAAHGRRRGRPRWLGGPLDPAPRGPPLAAGAFTGRPAAAPAHADAG